jgi:hypothetical protein
MVAVGEQDEAATDMLLIRFDDLFRLWLAPSFFWFFLGKGDDGERKTT